MKETTMIRWRLRQICGVGCSFGEKNNNNMMVETNLWDETKIGITWPWEHIGRLGTMDSLSLIANWLIWRVIRKSQLNVIPMLMKETFQTCLQAPWISFKKALRRKLTHKILHYKNATLQNMNKPFRCE